MDNSRRNLDRADPLRMLSRAIARGASQVLRQGVRSLASAAAEQKERSVRRNGCYAGDQLDLTHRCDHCRKALGPGRADRLYCNAKCRSASAWALERQARDDDLAARPCAQCGGPLPAGNRSDTMYCSRKCYRKIEYARWIAAGNRQPPHSARRLRLLKSCAHCGQEFHPFDRKQRFCSRRCIRPHQPGQGRKIERQPS